MKAHSSDELLLVVDVAEANVGPYRLDFGILLIALAQDDSLRIELKAEQAPLAHETDNIGIITLVSILLIVLTTYVPLVMYHGNGLATSLSLIQDL